MIIIIVLQAIHYSICFCFCSISQDRLTGLLRWYKAEGLAPKEKKRAAVSATRRHWCSTMSSELFNSSPTMPTQMHSFSRVVCRGSRKTTSSFCHHPTQKSGCTKPTRCRSPPQTTVSLDTAASTCCGSS